MSQSKPCEGEDIERVCPNCEQDTTQTVTSVKYDGSGFARCSSCERLIVSMAGTYQQKT